MNRRGSFLARKSSLPTKTSLHLPISVESSFFPGIFLHKLKSVQRADAAFGFSFPQSQERKKKRNFSEFAWKSIKRTFWSSACCQVTCEKPDDRNTFLPVDACLIRYQKEKSKELSGGEDQMITTQMSLHCHSFPLSLSRSNNSRDKFWPLSSLFSRPSHVSICNRPVSSASGRHRLSARRLCSAISELGSEDNGLGSCALEKDSVKLTYLEGNSWLLDVGGFIILADPVLVGNQDFGVPLLIRAGKKYLKNYKLSDLPEVDCLLITQGLDDHCHLRTLRALSKKSPNLKVIATLNAKPLLDPLFKSVTYMEPGESCDLEAKTGSKVTVKATPGPTFGPPWQLRKRPENGYIIVSPQSQTSLYYEPHCIYNKSFLENERVDILITPAIKILLPYFTLVSGQEDAVQLAKLLQPKYVVLMKNGNLDAKGLLLGLATLVGTVESFKELLRNEAPDIKVVDPTPGEPVEILNLSN